MKFYSLNDVMRAHKGHWFDQNTIRFFRSRFGELINGRYFVSSEKFKQDAQRRYTVREVDDDANVKTVGEFQAFATRKQALARIDYLVKERA